MIRCLGILLVMLPGVVAAQPDSTRAEVLLNNCLMAERSLASDNRLSASDLAMGLSCMSYLRGMRDATTILNSLTGTQQMCVPETVTTSQLVRVVVKYLRDNPEKLHEHMGGRAFLAMVVAYPCK